MTAERKTFEPFTLMMRTEQQRETLIRWAQRMPLYPDQPYRVVIDDPLPAKSRDQEKHYHALIGDIARQYQHCGQTWEARDMKRILIDAFYRETKDDSDIGPLWWNMGRLELAPALRGHGFVALGIESRKFPSKLASAFIEWLLALGAELKIEWTNEPKP